MNTSYGQYSYASMFPQAQGNVYTIQNSMEVANVPLSGQCSVAICVPENLLYIKTIQNGAPTLSTYTITPYETPAPATDNTNERLDELEKNVNKLLDKFGGKDSVYL